MTSSEERRAEPTMPLDDATIIWGPEDDPDGNVQHIAEHGLTIDEVEDVLFNPRNQTGRSKSSGHPITFGTTFTGVHIAVIWEVVNDDPKMVRVRTAYEVRPKRRQ
jgi:hypothetical protein